jgi:hypothetical protein
MMSEVALTMLTDAQSTAMRTFKVRCERAIQIVIFSCCAIIPIIVVANPMSPKIAPALIALVVAIALYPFVLFTAIFLRTGLWWHLLDTHANYISISGMVITSAIAVASVLPLLLSGFTSGSVGIVSVVLLLISVIPVFTPVFRSFIKPRADHERVRYSDKWFILERLSIWRILFLLIPYERA